MSDLKVKADEPLSARKWNRVVDRAIKTVDGSEAGPGRIQRSVAKVKNSSGRDYGIGELLQLTDFIGPTANAPFEATDNVIYDAEQPTWHTAIDRICVTAEPIADGEFGMVILRGQCAVSVSSAATSGFVMVDPSTTYQAKAASGSGIARILGQISSGFLLVDLWNASNVWRYELTQDTQTPSTTTAKLVDLNGTDFASSINLSDPLSTAKYRDSGDKGYCILAGNKFEALVPQPKTIQVVTDFIIGEGTITIERKNVTVFGDDAIDDEVVEGDSC